MAVLDQIKNNKQEEENVYDPERAESISQEYYGDEDFLAEAGEGDEDDVPYDEDEDEAEEKPVNKTGTIILVTAIIVLTLAIGLLIYNMANQRSSQKAIKEWVAAYLYDQVAEDGTSLLTDDEIRTITDDVTYKIYSQLGQGGGDIGTLASSTGLTEEQVKTIIRDLDAAGVKGENGLEGCFCASYGYSSGLFGEAASS